VNFSKPTHRAPTPTVYGSHPRPRATAKHAVSNLPTPAQRTSQKKSQRACNHGANQLRFEKIRGKIRCRHCPSAINQKFAFFQLRRRPVSTSSQIFGVGLSIDGGE